MEPKDMTHPTTEQRELLELAAKAANVAGEYRRVHQTYGDQWVDGIALADHPYFWNPITDDGDAFRLAVKLRLDVMTCCYRDEIQVGGKVRATTFQPIDGKDRCEAVRLAIVRAAAAIAKGENA